MAKKVKIENNEGTKKGTDKAIDVAMKNFKGFCKKASEIKEPEFITTGHYYLDLAIAHGISPDDPDFDPDKHKNGGIPLGKVTEFSGTEGSGKSSESYRVVANAQKLGHKCLWVDAEHSFSHDLARIYGVDLEALDVADLIDVEKPDHLYSAEEIFDRICDACTMGYKVIVLDSVANLMTEAETENYLAEGGVGMGGVAGVLSKAMKRVVNYSAKYDTAVILINQIREKIGQMFGNPEYTPGGRALKHNCSVRIKIQKQTDKDKGPIFMETEHGPVLIGNYSFIYIQKNRFGKPVSGEIRIPMYYEPYFPGAEDIIFDEAFRLKLISKRLTVRTWIAGDMKGEGKTGLIAAIKEAGRLEELVNEIKAAALAEKSILPPEVLNYKASDKLADVSEEEVQDEKAIRPRKSKNTSSRTGKPVESEPSIGSDS